MTDLRLTETELFALRQLERRKEELLRPEYRTLCALIAARLGLPPGTALTVDAGTGEISDPKGASDRGGQHTPPAPSQHRDRDAAGNDATARTAPIARKDAMHVNPRPGPGGKL